MNHSTIAMIRSLLIILSLAATATAAEWVLPAENQGDWTPGSGVGVTGGIDQYRAGGINARGTEGGGTTFDVTADPYFADNTGAVDCKTAVQAAVDAARDGDLVYFPAGTYTISSSISVKDVNDGITIRGAGTDQTLIQGDVAVAALFLHVGSNDSGTTYAVSGTKTKGTSTFTVSSSAGFTPGHVAKIIVSNEEDNTRIIAGAAPTWSNSGFRDLRTINTRVVSAPTATTVTLATPLPWDCTNYDVSIRDPSLAQVITERVGYEDLSFAHLGSSKYTFAISLTGGEECWVYNVHFPEWDRNLAAGSCVMMSGGFRCEVRKCYFNVPSPASASDDGSIQWAGNTSCLVVDNIMTGWDVGIYNSGKTYGNVVVHNYVDCNKAFLVAHNAHPSLDIYEGNVASSIAHGGYHGSVSHLTVFRNWSRAANFNRFARNFVLAGNLFGEDGATSGAISYGNGLGNGSAYGFAGPTGLSDREGAIDYIQPGYGVGGGSPNTYVIQEEDIFVGDFWDDWGMTGTLTTRTSDTVGVVTVSGGNWTDSKGLMYLSLYWDGFTKNRIQSEVTNIDGLNITIGNGSLPGTGLILPVEGTVFDGIWTFAQGYAERDLDVEASFTEAENYTASAVGTGSITDTISPDTLPNSLVYSAEPSWWGDDSFAGDWPPVDPDSPTFSIDIIPAGARYLAESNIVATPTFSPVPGTYGSTQTVTISCSTPSSTIYYTLDGSEPDSGDSVFSTDLSVSETTTIKAFATAAGMDDSSVATGTFTISAPGAITGTATTVNATTLNVGP